MKTHLILFVALGILLAPCFGQADHPLLRCLEEYIAAEPYRSNFAAIEQALLSTGDLESTDGQAYRQLALKAIRRDDLKFVLPATVELSPLRGSYYCWQMESDDLPVLLQQFFLALDSVARAPDLSPQVIAGSFLEHFTEEDWDQPLTRHLFYAFVSYEITKDKGILVKLPPWTDDEPDITRLDSRNVFSVLVNAENQIFARGERIELGDLREQVKLFITNPNAEPNLAESPQRAIISLQNDRGTLYRVYLDVYNEIKAAYEELWNEYCQARFGVPYNDDLPPGIRQEVKKAIPFVVTESAPGER